MDIDLVLEQMNRLLDTQAGMIKEQQKTIDYLRCRLVAYEKKYHVKSEELIQMQLALGRYFAKAFQNENGNGDDSP